MLLNRVRCCSAALTVALLAGTALADLPAALDRAPKGAAVTIGVRNVQEARTNIERLVKQFNEEAVDQLSMLDAITEVEGFNKAGSFAMVMLGDPAKEDFGDENIVLILPVTDWAKFSAAMGGEAGQKTTNLATLDASVMARDLGGGYIAVGQEETLTAFKDASGQIAEHKALLGQTGTSVADAADVVAFVNVQMFAAQIEQAIEAGKGQMEMAAGMMAAGNPDAEKGIQDLMQGFEGLAKDAQSFVVGMTTTPGGMAMDVAVHFKEGTASGTRFTHTGGLATSPGILGSMPKMPFLTAFAVDMSHPFIRSTYTKMAEMSKENGGVGMGQMIPGQIEKIDAMGFLLGSNPALMSTGIFAKALTFQQTKDPAGLLADTRAAIGKMSMNENGIKIDAKLTQDAVEIAGQKVDKMKTTIEIDPDSPMAQAQQFLTIFTGTSGEMGGMMTQTKNGVLATMSANTDMMTKAINAQKGEGALAGDADFKAVAGAMPEGRVFEGYLGVKGLADTIAGVLQLFGQPMPVEIKEELPPIGMGVTAGTGGLRARVVVPDKVVATFVEMAKKMQEMQEGGEPPAPEQPADQPVERRKPRL